MDHSQKSQSKRQVSELSQCDSSANGLFPHPYDCGKFLHCDRGRTFVVECFAGTVFNGEAGICDWPRNVDCGARQWNKNTAAAASSPSHSQANEEEPFRGEGIINIRTDNSQRIAARPSHGHQNAPLQYHQVQYRPQESQIRIYQHQNPRFTSSNRPRAGVQTIPDPDRIVFIDTPDYEPSYFGLTNDFPNRASVADRPQVQIPKDPQHFPELNVLTRRVGDEFTKYFTNPKPNTHQTPSANAFQRPIVLRITPQQFIDMNLVSRPVGNAFNTHIVNPRPKPVLKVLLSPKIEAQTRPKPAPIDFIGLVRQGTPYNHSASHQFPQINLMTPIVGNPFYQYFSFVRPKSTPRVSTTETSSSNEQVQPTINDVQNESQPTAEKSLFHGESHLNRNISSPLDNYNRLYYKPAKTHFNPIERGTESNQILISDSLMQLLRPYLDANASKTSSASEPTVDNDATNSIDGVNSNRADVETFTTTNDGKHIQTMHSNGRRPTARPTDWNAGDAVPSTYRPPSRFPATESPQRPPYHQPGAYDPNQIFFPGPHTQSHPMRY